MPETSPKNDTSTDTGSEDEAHAHALAQSWALPGQPRDLWPNIEQALEADLLVSPEVTAAAERAKREGIPFVDMEKHRPEPSAIACVTADLVYHYRVVPVRKDANRLFLAMENPRDIHAVDAVRLHSRLMVQPMLAPMSQIAAAIKECYPLTDAAGGRGTVPPVPPVATSASSAGHDPIPPELLGVLTLWQNGKTVTEIATELELTEATVKTRIHRARAKIRQASEEDTSEYASFEAFLQEWEGQKENASLSHPQEKWLARCVERGGREGERAREILVNANLRLVTSIAKKYQNRGIAMEDLIQEGTLGLIHAVDKYDWRRGFRFSTYATHCVRQALGRVIEGDGRQAHFFLESPGASGPSQDLRQALRDEINRAQEGVRNALNQARERLSKREQEALSLRYGLSEDQEQPMTLEQVGNTMELSREEARELEVSALRKLRRPSPEPDNPLNEILAELKALRQEVGELRREVAQLRRSERKPAFGTALLPFITADDPGLPLG